MPKNCNLSMLGHMSAVDPNFQTLSEYQFSLLKTIEREYAEGMLLLNAIDKSVTIYGGARLLPDDDDYKKIYEIGRYFGQNGWYVITGGGPGAMTAALQGAREVGGKTAAFRIDLEREEPQKIVPDIDYLCTQFSVRKFLLRQSDVLIVAPGGFGTFDELFELVNLIKTNKYPLKHVFLLNRKFWDGVLTWLQEMVCQTRQLIPAPDLEILIPVDSVEEIVAHLSDK